MEFCEHIFSFMVFRLFFDIHNSWLMSCQWYIETNLAFTYDTIQIGANVSRRGYFYWCLTDNDTIKSTLIRMLRLCAIRLVNVGQQIEPGLCICRSGKWNIIGWNYGLSPVRHQAINNDDVLIWPIWTHFSIIWIQPFWYNDQIKKCHQ